MIRRRRASRRAGEDAFVRWCNVYLEIDGDRAIVATCFNHDGLCAEMPDGSVVIDARGDGELGQAVLSALASCEHRSDFNYRDSKPSDWPAYQASKERSIRAFEQRWRYLMVRGANSHNVTWQLEAPLDGDHSLALTAAVAPVQDHVRVGAVINYFNGKLQELST